ncbi:MULTISPECIES: urea ABC transporter ATP-binding subunit UrtE [Thalassolituus]|jgi:urea transport system ATP-binding protein|uniref:urea ABC transporter ATP-binding subunit UrtE n=1 Tax=Thalassolituus TaxID=187492 RepID=UPI000C412116|nr:MULTISPECIES: urea ABC transporter ATP-binding subunit UrtE [Thalassolituus]MAX87549.1 urea ABC transporter ATP-binding subunit UrtE [Oceanospirillaceae bacterium]MEC8908304.1 urea ABC transporter ATP-binding subunit UrtE [Pseudomonadota bacterium]HCG77602.1 urea ABC transporter ATP-binding subunit UrtE [Oceanospirillales bacterium]MEC9409638.1 urea ABC transporter ATP-binding subunit UrtE [Pseudomonadota bacterium]MED5441656.1 urea ABC transporter ATP-binding subunit UrtE [Pseudomonadota b|tara:strand:- start:2679 stop:3368 length:690 start_codon:yes stop_codon:yes gene_type:complete
MLQLNDYSVAYGQSTIIDGMNLTLKENEIIAILGRNGMGKTTLMKSLIGMIPSKGGTVKLADKELSPLKSHERVSAGLAFVPQGRMIFSTMTVEENIETGLTSTGERNIPSDLYSIFPVLDEMKHRRGGNLSGGQQQQLAIARALASNPDVLILDEPTEGIQPSIIKDMAKTLKQIRTQRGLSILVSEQVLSFALDVADRILVIEKGKIVLDVPVEEADQETISKYLSV